MPGAFVNDRLILLADALIFSATRGTCWVMPASLPP